MVTTIKIDLREKTFPKTNKLNAIMEKSGTLEFQTAIY